MHMRALRPGVGGAAATVALLLVACSPTFNWRESQPEGSDAALMFPCRPEHHQRTVQLGAAMLPMQLHVCEAGGAVFSLAVLDVADPAQVTSLLSALRAQALANMSATLTEEREFAPAGATPNAESARVRMLGTRPDGRPVVADAAFFVKGLRLYQATILGSDQAPGREAVDTFFGAIRLP